MMQPGDDRFRAACASDLVFKRQGALWDLVKNRVGHCATGLTSDAKEQLVADLRERYGNLHVMEVE